MTTEINQIDPNQKDEQLARTQIISQLKSNIVTVTFNKKDGEQRIMTCTLLPNLLPKTEVKESTTVKKENLNTISAYDINAKGWRSFIVKSVTKVEING